jgi:hypothetical protein
MAETATRRSYGWKLGTFRLPTGDYTFFVEGTKMDGPDDTIELELKITGPVQYTGHRIRAFVPREDWQYPKQFHARLYDEYGIISPDTVQKRQ